MPTTEQKLESCERALERQQAENARLRNSMKKIGTIIATRAGVEFKPSGKIKAGEHDVFISTDVYDDAGLLILPEVKL